MEEAKKIEEARLVHRWRALLAPALLDRVLLTTTLERAPPNEWRHCSGKRRAGVQVVLAHESVGRVDVCEEQPRLHEPAVRLKALALLAQRATRVRQRLRPLQKLLQRQAHRLRGWWRGNAQPTAQEPAPSQSFEKTIETLPKAIWRQVGQVRDLSDESRHRVAKRCVQTTLKMFRPAELERALAGDEDMIKSLKKKELLTIFSSN